MASYRIELGMHHLLIPNAQLRRGSLHNIDKMYQVCKARKPRFEGDVPIINVERTSNKGRVYIQRWGATHFENTIYE